MSVLLVKEGIHLFNRKISNRISIIKGATISVYADSKFCPEAELSDEQLAHIKESHRNFRDSTCELSKEERKTARADLQQKILETLSTSEAQKEALLQCFEKRKEKRKNRNRDHCPKAKLSNEQKADMKELHKNFRKSTCGLSKEERKAARAELHQTVLETIPTTEGQRDALSKCFERRKERRKK